MLSLCHSPTIYIDGVSCFGPPYKSVNIHVCSTPYLQQFSQSIHQAAAQAGMDYENFGGQWQYHISLANSAFAKREWTDAEYCLACNILKRMDFNAHFQIEQMQLWYPRKHDYVIHTFPLKG